MIKGTREVDGRIELAEDLSASPLFNHDLAPTTIARRTWNLWHIAALWVGMAVCIPTYMLAAGLMRAGLSWWQAVLTVTLGNFIVLIPMALNAHAGAKYGIPFPVFLRAPFGTAGANIPALLRAAVACGWFGIQTWIGGKALYMLAAVLLPSLKESSVIGFLGINGWQFAFFLLFWAINLFFVLRGTESIKWLETWTAPILIAVGLGLIVWGATQGGGLGRILRHSSNFSRPTVTATREGSTVVVGVRPVEIDGRSRPLRWRIAGGEWGADRIVTESREVTVEFEPPIKPMKVSVADPGSSTFWTLFFPMLTAMVGYWATLSLNIPDFTRFAKSQRDQVVGQFLGLPATMGFYSFVGVAATCAALVLFSDILVVEQAPWDPVDLLGRFTNPVLVVGAMLFLAIATLTTNIAANVVSPANDFSNLAPKLVSFKTGGIITALIGVLIMPWKLVERPDTYIFTWLIGYGALLGPIAGILIADYYVVRRTRLELPELYRVGGKFAGVNWATIAILLLAIAPNLPGFLATVGAAEVATFWKTLFTYAWFVGFGVAFILYSLWKPTRTSSTANG